MDLFGVEHPQGQEIGYCCILGPQQDAEGLAVYKGSEGLDSYEHLFDGDADTPETEVLYEQDCLVLIFLPEHELFDSEKELIALHCHSKSFSGKYPVFRDYSPGWVPWPIREQFQADWLEVAVEQALHVATRFRSDRDLLDHMSNNEAHLLIRRPKNPLFLDEWEDDWVPLELDESRVLPNQQLYLRSNCSEFPRSQEEWLAALFYLPQVEEESSGRPYLPLIVILADRKSGSVIHEEKFQPGGENFFLQEAFVAACRKVAYLPNKLWVAEVKEKKRWIKIGQILDISVELDKESGLARQLKNKYLP